MWVAARDLLEGDIVTELVSRKRHTVSRVEVVDGPPQLAVISYLDGSGHTLNSFEQLLVERPE